MSVDAYPVGSDLLANIEANGLSVPSSVTGDSLNRTAIASWQEFERRTGYRPLLGEAGATTHFFDSPWPETRLNLRGAFWAISEVRVSVVNGDLTTGTVLTLDSDFKLYPLNAALETPAAGWNEIEFLTAIGLTTNRFPSMLSGSSVYGPIAITGKRGLYEAIPEDIWQAICDYGSANAVPALARAAIIKQGPVQIEYSRSGGDTLYDTWVGNFEDTVMRYQRSL